MRMCVSASQSNSAPKQCKLDLFTMDAVPRGPDGRQARRRNAVMLSPKETWAIACDQFLRNQLGLIATLSR